MGILEVFDIHTPTPEEWWQLGAALGLSPCEPLHAYDQDMCYRRMERTRGALPLGAAPSFTQWLCGQHGGVDTTVLQYETGSGSSSTTWTAAVARVDPPLWLGLNVRRETFFDGLFGGPDVQLGHRAADDKLRVTSFDPGRTAMLLSPMDDEGRRALEHMLALDASYTFCISDSRVEVAQTGVHTDPAALGPMVSGATSLARWLAARRRRVPPNQGELVDLRAWERFAASHGFELDPWRITARGRGAGAAIEIALEIEGQERHIALLVRFQRPVPVPFQVVRTSAPAFLQGLFSQDIVVGERSFDDVYKVTGADPASVRALLGRPALLAALTGAASLTSDLKLGQNGLDMRISGRMPREEDLAWLASTASLISGELTGRPPAQAPYR